MYLTKPEYDGMSGQIFAQSGGTPQRRKTVPQLVPVERGADLHDQGARQSHVAEGAAGLSRRVRSQGGQGLVPQVRRICEAARGLGCGMGQDLRLPAVIVAHMK